MWLFRLLLWWWKNTNHLFFLQFVNVSENLCLKTVTGPMKQPRINRNCATCRRLPPTAGHIVVDSSHWDLSIANWVVVFVIHHAFYPMMHLKIKETTTCLCYFIMILCFTLSPPYTFTRLSNANVRKIFSSNVCILFNYCLCHFFLFYYFESSVM